MRSSAWAGWSILVLMIALFNRHHGAAGPTGVVVHSKKDGIILIGSHAPIAPFDREWNSAHQLAMGRSISINRSTTDQLETLPHIGPKRAASIVRYRNENGYFSSIGSLSKVRGIGPRTVQKVAPFVIP